MNTQRQDLIANFASSSATPTPTSNAPSDATKTLLANPTSTTSPTTASSAAPTTLVTSTRPSSSSSSSSSTTSSSSSSSPTATSGATALCPEADNTIYNVNGSDKRFLRTCGIDYTGDAEAIDMSNTLAASMGECMEICAKTAQCAGAAWGSVTAAGGAVEQRCWLKRDLKKSHKVASDWNFATLM